MWGSVMGRGVQLSKSEKDETGLSAAANTAIGTVRSYDGQQGRDWQLGNTSGGQHGDPWWCNVGEQGRENSTVSLGGAT